MGRGRSSGIGQGDRNKYYVPIFLSPYFVVGHLPDKVDLGKVNGLRNRSYILPDTKMKNDAGSYRRSVRIQNYYY